MQEPKTAFKLSTKVALLMVFVVGTFGCLFGHSSEPSARPWAIIGGPFVVMMGLLVTYLGLLFTELMIFLIIGKTHSANTSASELLPVTQIYIAMQFLLFRLSSLPTSRSVPAIVVFPIFLLPLISGVILYLVLFHGQSKQGLVERRRLGEEVSSYLWVVLTLCSGSCWL